MLDTHVNIKALLNTKIDNYLQTITKTLSASYEWI